MYVDILYDFYNNTNLKVENNYYIILTKAFRILQMFWREQYTISIILRVTYKD